MKQRVFPIESEWKVDSHQMGFAIPICPRLVFLQGRGSYPCGTNPSLLMDLLIAIHSIPLFVWESRSP